MHHYEVTLTDTFSGEANYAWVKRVRVTMPELTHYGYDGSSNYAKANKVYTRELMRRAKAAVNLTGVRGVTEPYGGDIVFRPHGMACILFIDFVEEGA